MSMANAHGSDGQNGSSEIRLRSLDMSDVDNLLTWVNDPQVVGKFATFHEPLTREDEERYVHATLASKNDLVFSIEANGTYVGQAGIHEIEWRNRKGRAALVIRSDFQGVGYGQAAMRELLRTVFTDYGIHKVFLIVDPNNERARHVYEKVGFKPEGVLREEYFRDGVYHDMVRLLMLDHEFYDMHGGGHE